MTFASEADFEAHIRELIASCIADTNIRVLEYKTVADIIICRDGHSPAIFFLEVKYFQLSKGRLGFGNNKGAGIQPEILLKRPAYLESHLRWILGSDAHKGAGYWLLTSETLREYVAGGSIGRKQNNIQEALFRQAPSLDEQEVVNELSDWLRL